MYKWECLTHVLRINSGLGWFYWGEKAKMAKTMSNATFPFCLHNSHYHQYSSKWRCFQGGGCLVCTVNKWIITGKAILNLIENIQSFAFATVEGWMRVREKHEGWLGRVACVWDWVDQLRGNPGGGDCIVQLRGNQMQRDSMRKERTVCIGWARHK